MHPQCLLPPHTSIPLPVQASPCTPQPLIWGIRMRPSLSGGLQLAFDQKGMNSGVKKTYVYNAHPFCHFGNMLYFLIGEIFTS